MEIIRTYMSIGLVLATVWNVIILIFGLMVLPRICKWLGERFNDDGLLKIGKTLIIVKRTLTRADVLEHLLESYVKYIVLWPVQIMVDLRIFK